MEIPAPAKINVLREKRSAVTRSVTARDLISKDQEKSCVYYRVLAEWWATPFLPLMPDDPNQNVDAADHQDGNANGAGPGPGAKPVPAAGIVVISAYLVAAMLLCLYGLLVFWPVPTPSGGQQANERSDKQTVSSTGPVDSNKTASRSTSHSPRPSPSPTATAEASPASLSTSALPVVSDSATPSPSATASGTPTASATPGRAKAFGKEFEIWDEVRLLWIVILAGALGSLIHAVRSVYWYVGNRDLVWSWIGKYLLMPFSGSALAVVFYFVVRGGFFSPQAGFANTSPFGFAAMAALVGLFSEPAVLKLKQIAETVFSKPEPGANATPQNTDGK